MKFLSKLLGFAEQCSNVIFHEEIDNTVLHPLIHVITIFTFASKSLHDRLSDFFFLESKK